MKIIRLVTILIVAALLVVSHAMAEPCPPDTDKKRFLKVARDEKKVPRALTTSIVSYQPDGGEYSVDLISALHIGENSYYKDLNARFESYDALLYELIAPADTDHSEMNDDSGGSALSFLQRGFKSLLGLEFQLDGIDYGKPNFVHADMSPEQFVNRMNERGESFLGIFLKMFLKSAELQKKSPQLSTEVALMQMLLDPNQKVSLRTMVAQQFEDMD
ncbi:MAG: hypothetical protein J5J00_05525, partial [Deltaproteobacteria bacterium]|nr:hypothetical protein [Deltaproteobacteria bacterium]